MPPPDTLPPDPFSADPADRLAVARARIAEEAERRTGRLDLSGLGLPHLPEELFALTHLRELDLGGENFWEADSRNRIGADAHRLAVFTRLELLDVGWTDLQSLDVVRFLPRLENLSIWGTPIGDLSPLSSCAGLHTLNCSGTGVSDLSPLSSCAGLHSLDCFGTQVSDLSPLSSCAGLHTFWCSFCRLTTGLPDALIDSPALTDLYAWNTTMPGLPDGVLSTAWNDNCLPRLRAYLADMRAGAAVAPGVKLLLLGNGRVGKTQIARRLAGKEFQPESESTHGIRIGDVALPGLPDTRLWIWDFGGQDLYHGTHALFLRSPAVLAAVWAEEMEAEPTHSHGGQEFRNHPLPYWLAIAHHQGHPDSPTLVVQTHCDAPGSGALHPPADPEMLKAARCLGTVKVGSQSGRGFGTLREALADAVRWLHKQGAVPKVGPVWRSVQLRLEAMRGEGRCRLLTRDEFAALCREEGCVTAPEHLLPYLDAYGTVIHRPGLFDDRIVLDQNWAMEAVYAVFDRAHGAHRLIRERNRGRFTLDDLALTVWAGYGADDRRLFLSLMQSCGICFLHRTFGEGEDAVEEFIAPDLLPPRDGDALAARWDAEAATETRVFRHPFLHGGLIRAIMAELGRQAGPDVLYWQGGLCGYEAETRSRFLIEDCMTGPWQGEIRVQTQRGAAADLLARLVWVVERQQDRLSLHPEPDPEPRPAPARPAPEETALTFGQEKTADREWYVSYAWGDDTPEGKAREAIVDRLCAAATDAGIEIKRDKNVLGPGDVISDFMRRLVAGDRVFVILSEKYLRSPNCMFELSEIWRNCKHDPDLFRRTVRVYALDCAKLKSEDDRFDHADYWEDRFRALDDRIKKRGIANVGERDFAHIRQMKAFAYHIGDILGTLHDTVQPQTFDDLVNHGFAADPP